MRRKIIRSFSYCFLLFINCVSSGTNPSTHYAQIDALCGRTFTCMTYSGNT